MWKIKKFGWKKRTFFVLSNYFYFYKFFFLYLLTYRCIQICNYKNQHIKQDKIFPRLPKSEKPHTSGPEPKTVLKLKNWIFEKSSRSAPIICSKSAFPQHESVCYSFGCTLNYSLLRTELVLQADAKLIFLIIFLWHI